MVQLEHQTPFTRRVPPATATRRHALARHRIGRGGLAAIVMLGLLAGNVAAQCSSDCTDPTKTCLCVLDPADAPVSVTPFGAIDRERAIVGRPLDIGDQLLSAREDTVVELACPGGSEVKLHGRFHAIIRPSSEDQDCAFDLLAGNADVLAAKPTQVEAGEATMGSRTTQYGLRLRREDDGVSVECVVFEGEADVRYGRGPNRPLGESTKMTWNQRWSAPRSGAVDTTDVRATSLVYARADLARAQARGRPIPDARAALRELRSSYTRVLTRPRDAQARIDLAALHTDLDNSKQVLYQLQVAERLGPTADAQRASIATMKYAALKRTGRDAEAEAEIRKVQQLAPDQYERLRRLDPAQIRRDDPSLQQLRSRSTPPVR